MFLLITKLSSVCILLFYFLLDFNVVVVVVMPVSDSIRLGLIDRLIDIVCLLCFFFFLLFVNGLSFKLNLYLFNRFCCT